ncbi:hypothetical protein PR048_011317 [Dryococelus australis]|uniref:Uncharacterized protein n=1 Tax=Dryococelus australis TaxID=614101 RepID=A0ABQ9HL87_9NEOP|nr:hypothetical protein PR048_011317 [Dryococelus australis]
MKSLFGRFSLDLSFTPPLHYAIASYSYRFTIIDSETTMCLQHIMDGEISGVDESFVSSLHFTTSSVASTIPPPVFQCGFCNKLITIRKNYLCQE